MPHALYPAFRLNRHKLLISCASVAIAAAALAPSRAKAQAFQGTPTTASGTVTYTRSTPGTETVTVGSSTATINWAPSDSQGTGHVNFLPEGNAATYQGASGLTDFTVLNRIVPTDATRAIELNGSVLSKLDGGATGGNVWFYSPGGILIGSKAVFDVGGLLLSSIDLPNGFSADTNYFSATFSKTTDNAGAISILPGAQINARNTYLAIVAPRIEQGGNVQVNGSAAYAAADGLTMSFSSGLFDIQVPVGAGTSDSNGIVHTGTTGGAANATGTDRHTIYMIAVPKNQAMTMLLGGSVGFAPAAQGATVQNGQILLLSGMNTSGYWASPYATPAGGAAGGIDVGSQGAATFTSAALGYASGPISVDAAGQNVSFSSDLTLGHIGSLGAGDVDIGAHDGGALSIGGNLSLTSTGMPTASSIAITADGGTVTVGGTAHLQADLPADDTTNNLNLYARNGSIAITGPTTLDGSVNADTLALPATGNSVNATGGTVTIQADSGGSIASGDVTINSNATGQHNEGGGNLSGGSGTGGNISVLANAGGQINLNGNLYSYASGYGGYMGTGSTQGGTGLGGNLLLQPSGAGSSIAVTGSVYGQVYGDGGNYYGGGSPASATGGQGHGGSATIELAGGTITIGSGLSLYAEANGGTGKDGGPAFGGIAGVVGASGTANLGQSINLYADATGGNAYYGLGGSGGDGTGGGAFIKAVATPGVSATAATITGGSAYLVAQGTGGAGGSGDGATIAPGHGGDGRGGEGGGALSGGAYALADAAGGSLTLGYTSLNSLGYGGAGGSAGTGQTGGAGGNGYGGFSKAGTYNPWNVTSATGVATFAGLSIDASGYGGAGGSANDVASYGHGGNGYGGGAYQCADTTSVCGGSILAAQGNVNSTSSVSLRADAGGGSGSTGGDAFGGSSTITVSPSSQLHVSALQADSSASGGYSYNAAGGSATGGTATLSASGGATVNVDNYTYAYAAATGGTGITGGSGTGGLADIEIDNASLNSTNSYSIYAYSDGRGGTSSGTGLTTGSQTGGTARVVVTNNGAVNAQSIQLEATGVGGAIDIKALSGGQVNATSEIAANTDGSLFITDDSGAGAVTTPTLSVTTGNITGLADAHITNLYANLTGDGTMPDIDVPGYVQIYSTGNLALGNVAAGSQLYARASGDLTAQNVTTPYAYFIAGGTATFPSIVDAPYVNITAGNVTGLSGANITTFTANLTGDASSLPALNVSGSVQVSSTGNLTLNDITAGNSVSVSSGGSLVVHNVGTQTAYQSAYFSAKGLADFEGTVSSPNIYVNSSDINIAAGASLGVQGLTQNLELVAQTDSPVYIGSGVTPSPGAYVLNEQGDIGASTVQIYSSPLTSGSSPDIYIGDVHIDGSQTSGGGVSSVSVVTGSGSIKVLGAIDFADAGQSDSLQLNAGKNIEVNTDTGGILMSDPSGNLAGYLTLQASNVWVADGSILSQLETDSNYAGRDTTLSINSGTSNPYGFIGAGSIYGYIGTTFFVQNSGTSTDVGGLTIGDGELLIYGENSTTPAVVHIYGRQIPSTSTTSSDSAFTSPSRYTGGVIADGSTINQCALTANTCTAPPPISPPPPPPPTETVAPTQSSEAVLGPVDQVASPIALGTSEPSQSSQEEGEKESSKKKDNADSGVDPALGLLNAGPVQLKNDLEQPVTSGGMNTTVDDPGIRD